MAAYPFPEFWELQQAGSFSDILIFCQGGVLKSHRWVIGTLFTYLLLSAITFLYSSTGHQFWASHSGLILGGTKIVQGFKLGGA
jgi:hypothetical protein